MTIKTEEAYRWLKDKPVLSEFRGRVAALIAHHMGGGTVDERYQYWLDKRPDFFTSEQQ